MALGSPDEPSSPAALPPRDSSNLSEVFLVGMSNYSLGASGTEDSGNESLHYLEEDAAFTYITEGVILTLVSCFGLVGNVMSIFVLMRVAVQGSFSNLLCGLACFDALFLFTAILAFGIRNLSPWYEKHLFIYIMAASFGLLHTFRVGSVMVTLAVNFERFYAIVFPLKHFRWKKYLLPVSVTVAIVYNLPKYFEMKIETDEETNTPRIVTTSLRRNPIYMSLYVFWSKFIFIEIIPYFTILICNIFIICKITKSARFRRRFNTSEEETSYSPSPPLMAGSFRSSSGRSAGSTRATHSSFRFRSHASQRETLSAPRKTFLRKQKEEHNLGIILIGMSTLFIICQSFKIVPDLYELIWCNPSGSGGQCEMPGIIKIIIRLSHLLVCVNSSANFLIYYLNGRKFRIAWLETYGRCFGYKRNGGDETQLQHSQYQSNYATVTTRLTTTNNHEAIELMQTTMGVNGGRRSVRSNNNHASAAAAAEHRLLDRHISCDTEMTTDSPGRTSMNGLLSPTCAVARSNSVRIEMHGGSGGGGGVGGKKKNNHLYD